MSKDAPPKSRNTASRLGMSLIGGWTSHRSGMRWTPSITTDPSLSRSLTACGDLQIERRGWARPRWHRLSRQTCFAHVERTEQRDHRHFRQVSGNGSQEFWLGDWMLNIVHLMMDVQQSWLAASKLASPPASMSGSRPTGWVRFGSYAVSDCRVVAGPPVALDPRAIHFTTDQAHIHLSAPRKRFLPVSTGPRPTVSDAEKVRVRDPIHRV